MGRTLTRGSKHKPKDVVAICTTATTIEYLRASLEQLEQAVDEATESRSWQAVAALKYRALETRERLDQEVAKAALPDDSMNDEELLGIIVQAVGQFSVQQIERLEDAIAFRRGRPVVRLVETG
jgi:hypothetical protein